MLGGENLYRFEGNIQNQTDPLGLFAPAAGYAGYILWEMLFGTAAAIGIHGTMEVMEEAKQSSESSASKIECGGKCKPKCPDDEFKKLTDDNHQNEIAKAWANYYKCEGMR